ncbi:heavy metal translocating P-type ATPase [Microcella daejeonensis]|uniref:Cation-transporting P-type ATPase B n=1 Tax=Microcella daejeonensis TaxID=2994971 RepID=A0A9E8MMX5_9MICO|nr:heavy metal translocating P-type ATPase [Microcella daejeonensis]WAB82349.1 heavy metal translocating P-type ATPase [Microcella daejeonensis]
MTDTLSAPAAPAPAPVQLELTGMTCASCANRIERGLNKVPGVEASVNYATEKATVRSVAGDEPLDVDALLAAVQKAGYGASLVVPREASAASRPAADAAGPDRDELAPLRRRLLISLVLTVPVVALSMIPALQFTNWQWLVLTLAAPVAVWGAWPFHRAAAVNARHGAATMDTLISVGVAAAFLWSLYALFLGEAGMAGMTMSMQLFGAPEAGAHEIYLEVAAAVTVFILAGRYMEARAKRESGAAMNALLDLAARDAIVLRDGVEVSVPVEQLQVNDRFIVRPGSTVATDGVVIEGQTSLDASLLTGESLPVDVEMDSRVTGGTVNVGGGRLVVEASRVGADTELARLARLVEEAQTGKARVQRLADRVSGVFVPVVILLSLGTLAGWLLLGGTVEQAFTAAVATLIIACPCALGLATPTALLVGTGRGSQLGILIKGPQVLEQTRRIDTIVLDKTGTITSGEMAVVAVTPLSASALDADALLALAAAAENGSEHPLARAVVAHAAERGLALPPVSGFTAHAGAGVSAEVDGHAVAIGRPAWLAEQWAITVPDAAAADLAAHESRGATPIAVAVDGSFAGLVVLADTVKASAALAVERFRALGLEPMLLTGDNAGAAAAVAAEVGIDASAVRASVTPTGKLDAIRALQAEGRVVAMVGDGVNDAAALAAADLGIAMGGGTDAAMAASDLTIVSGDLLVVADGIRLARRTLRTIVGNLFWAFGYNVAAIPVAMLGLLNPLLAGLAMALSSVFVVTNSLRLRGFRALPRP